MKRTLIVDGDIVLFQIGRVTEDITDFGDEQMASYDHESAIRLINLVGAFVLYQISCIMGKFEVKLN